MSVPDHADISSGQHDVAWARGGDYTGPSRRTGLLTSAARRSASVFKMRDVSRHRSMDVLQGYVRDAHMIDDDEEVLLALVMLLARCRRVLTPRRRSGWTRILT